MQRKSNTAAFRIAIIIALGGFLMGFDASVISGVVKFIETDFDLTKLQLGWAVSSLTLTSTLAMLISGPISDKFGRRETLKVAAALYGISAIWSALATSFTGLVIARMLGGFGVGASLIIAPMFIAELAPPKIRGKMVSFNQLNIVLGISVAFFSNYLILQWGKSGSAIAESLNIGTYNWRWMLGVESIPAILYFTFLFFVPRSPRWLVLKKYSDEALKILKKLDPVNASMQLQAIQNSLKEEKNKNEKSRFRDLFKPALRNVLIIGVVIAAAQQLSGINAVFFYAPMIFEQTGIGTDASFVQAILVGLTNLVFTLVAIALIDKLGRKPLLLYGMGGIVIMMVVLGTSFSKATYEITTESYALMAEKGLTELESMVGQSFDNELKFTGHVEDLIGEEKTLKHSAYIISEAISINSYAVLFGIIGFVAAFAVSLGPVMWVLFSELFPNYIRGLAISFAGFVNSAVSFTVQLVFPWELANLGNAATFYIFGGFIFMAWFYVYLRIPETKGVPLEQLEQVLTRKKNS